MSAIQELSDFVSTDHTLITVGVFDGVHVGHQALFRRLVSQSSRAGLKSGVITFRQHPLTFLAPQNAPPRLASNEENLVLIKSQGVDFVIPLTFDAELAMIDARTFAMLLQHHLRMKAMILGWDFVMGYHRSGTLTTLSNLGKELGFTTDTIQAVTIDGETVSSTSIRRSLAEGNTNKAAAMLGRPFSLEGMVIRGMGRGVELGFPTANIDIDQNLVVPAEGVYATRVHLDGQVYQSVTAISRCPTFEGGGRTIEVHLLNFDADIYHRKIRVDIIEQLRLVQRYDSAILLKEQIARDIERAKEVLNNKLTGNQSNY